MAVLHRTLWYMGVKARVIPGFLSGVLEDEVPEGGTVVDLMSGTAVVAAWCADRWRVFANDVQAYAHVIARSLIEHAPGGKERLLRGIDVRRDLGEAFERNLALLRRTYRRPVAIEEGLLRRFQEGDRGAAWCGEYRAFLESPGSVHGASPAAHGRASLYGAAAKLLSDESIATYRRDPSVRPACLVTAYYANVYFGLAQSLVIDSLRAAVDELPRSATAKRVHYLSALLHAVSTSTSGTSHFAQPRHLHKDTELLAMAERRGIDVLSRFEECSLDIIETVRATHHREGNRCFLGDYRALAAGLDGSLCSPTFLLPGKLDLVYLDPPYTADNYSRFYHVLDVLARYDYPFLEKDSRGRILRGRYPRIESRFQSGFCRRGEVEGEFRNVIRAAAGAGAKLVISYASPSGLLLRQYERTRPGEDPVSCLEGLCRESYRDVETRRIAMMHSGQGDSNVSVDELLVICRGPRGK